MRWSHGASLILRIFYVKVDSRSCVLSARSVRTWKSDIISWPGISRPLYLVVTCIVSWSRLMSTSVGFYER